MTTSTGYPAPRAPPPVVRAALRLYERGPAFLLRHGRLRLLRAAYEQGSSAGRKSGDEVADPAIVDAGRRLRQQILAVHERKHAFAGYRVLLLQPASITAQIWFGDLERCMRHAGIECHLLAPGTSAAGINAAFEMLQPNVFMAREAPDTLQGLDLPFIERYKRESGCLRLLIPAWHSRAPRAGVPRARTTPAQDAWLRQLRSRGLSADAHFSIFEPEFNERFSRDPSGPAIECVTIPQACNPFTDYPIPAAKFHDYFMAASLTNDRVEVSFRFLRPVLRRYQGSWAGPRWGFGRKPIAPAEMPLHYAQARIALTPLVEFVQFYGAELTHRVYAAAACGAFQLTVSTAITGRYFRNDELVQASTPAEYALLFDHYVDRPQERNSIALAALHRVYGEHTCFHRIDKLVSHWNDWRRRGLF